MKESFIKAISYYLPEQVYTNEDLQKDFPEWQAEKVNSKIGIEERHIAAENETSLDLAVKAAEKMFAEYSIARDEIDYLIFCTQSPDFFLPSSACIIQNKLGLPVSCGAFDMNLGCSGFVYGLSVAKALVTSEMHKNVLLLTGETYSKYIHPQDKGNRSIFGDAATASLISTEGFLQIGDFILGTDGSGEKNLIVRTGAARYPAPLGDLTYNESNNPVSSDYLFMDGTEIFNFTLKAVPAVVESVLEKNHIDLDSADLFVFHQANKYILNFIRKKIKIPEEKFYYCLQNTGNTVSSTIPIALYEANREKRLIGNIVIAGFGVGYSWGSTVLKRIS
jgi:3-oxoacyl-[acyl-carrier-protein] synthase III